MFTGLVEAVGEVHDVAEASGVRTVTIHAPTVAAGMSVGESVAVDGACLTAVEVTPQGFTVEVVGTTLSRTIAGRYAPGSRVNLERALKVGDRLGGHWVQGHVDGLGRLDRETLDGRYRLLDFQIPAEIQAMTILHGSIAISGVSLTVNLLSPEACQVAVIPHTWEQTNLRDLRPGDPVNVEGDLLAKYVSRALENGNAARNPGPGGPTVPVSG
jgi:riboflavin synthase